VTITVVGVCADQLGHQVSHRYELDERGAASHLTAVAAVPAAAYFVTKGRVPIDWCHGRHLGQTAYLERRHGHLSVVAELDVDRLDGIDLFERPLFWSPETWEIRSRHGVDAELLAVALTPTPASVALPPVHLLAGTVDVAALRTHGALAGVLQRAVTARARRRYGDPLHIADLDAGPAPVAVRAAQHHAALDVDRRPAAPIEWWPGGGRIISVR
jgi:hypothetical protein